MRSMVVCECGQRMVSGKGPPFCPRCLRVRINRLLGLVMQEDEIREAGYWARQRPVSEEENQR